MVAQGRRLQGPLDSAGRGNQQKPANNRVIVCDWEVRTLERGSTMPTDRIAVPDAVYSRVLNTAAAAGTAVEHLATQALDTGRRTPMRRGRMHAT
jgi:hypothetical protein